MSFVCELSWQCRGGRYINEIDISVLVHNFIGGLFLRFEIRDFFNMGKWRNGVISAPVCVLSVNFLGSFREDTASLTHSPNMFKCKFF